MQIDNLITILIEGKWFLGELIEGDSVEIKYALKWGRNDGETFDNWLKKCNLGELTTIKMSKVASYSVEPLSKNQIRIFRQKAEKMDWVKENAITFLENKYYDNEFDD